MGENNNIMKYIITHKVEDDGTVYTSIRQGRFFVNYCNGEYTTSGGESPCLSRSKKEDGILKCLLKTLFEIK